MSLVGKKSRCDSCGKKKKGKSCKSRCENIIVLENPCSCPVPIPPAQPITLFQGAMVSQAITVPAGSSGANNLINFSFSGGTILESFARPGVSVVSSPFGDALISLNIDGTWNLACNLSLRLTSSNAVNSYSRVVIEVKIMLLQLSGEVLLVKEQLSVYPHPLTIGHSFNDILLQIDPEILVNIPRNGRIVGVYMRVDNSQNQDSSITVTLDSLGTIFRGANVGV